MTRLLRKLTHGYFIDGRSVVVSKLAAPADIIMVVYDSVADVIEDKVVIEIASKAFTEDKVLNAAEIQTELMENVRKIKKDYRYFYINVAELKLINFGATQTTKFR